jgi:hypothetical protein
MIDATKALTFLTSPEYTGLLRDAFEQGCVVLYTGEGFEMIHKTKTTYYSKFVGLLPDNTESQALILETIKRFLQHK